MPIVGKNYTVDLSEGMLVVAWPNKDVITDFGFKYWKGTYRPISWTTMIKNWDFDGPGGQVVFIALCVVLGVCATLCLCCLFCCFKKCCHKSSRVEIFDGDVA